MIKIFGIIFLGESDLMWFTGVCIVLTKNCNANCDICCFGCSNEICEKLDVIKTMDIIMDLKEKEGIRTVGVTGGEPFLYFDDLVYLLSESKKLGLGVTFTSNGFWGNDYQQAYNKLKKIKEVGVTFFTLSVDDFHKKYIPYESVINVINIAKELCINVIINSVSTNKSGRLKGVLEELGDTLLNCTLIELPCVPAGNAALRIKEDDYIYMDKQLCRACDLMNCITIFPNGDIYPCCSESGMSSVLYLGNMYKDTVEILLHNFYSNKVCYQLSHYGPKHIYDKYLDDNDKKNMRSKFVNVCDMCQSLFKETNKKEKIIKSIEVEI